MAFEYKESTRFMEILSEEWSKGTGAVATRVVTDRMRDEGQRFQDHQVGSYLLLLRESDKASILAESDVELANGNAVIIGLSDR